MEKMNKTLLTSVFFLKYIFICQNTNEERHKVKLNEKLYI